MKTVLFISASLLLLSAGDYCVAQTAEHKTYDYVTLVVKGRHPRKIYISYNGENYLSYSIADKVQGRKFDYNETINMIKKFEKEGYEIFSNTFTSEHVLPFSWDVFWPASYNYFLLRKEHKEIKENK